VRGSGVHASAVVIAPRPLTELVPLAKTKNDEIVTAYDMKAVEKMGLLKMDFLGLTTLTVIDDCLKLIEKTAARRWTSSDSAGRRGDFQEGLSRGADFGRFPV
jgi:DNA polymerase-3 subunit alpha